MKAVLFLFIICATVALSIWFPQLMLSPGKLSQGHQKIEKQCTSCHQLFWGVSDAKCILCHKPDQIGKDSSLVHRTQLQFHTSLKGESCTSCHTDHKGLDPALSTVAFNHKLLSPSMLVNCNSCHSTPTDSMHAQLSVACGSCHNTRTWQFKGSFDHALIIGINKTNCISCHQKPVDALHMSVQNNCVDCHSTSKWSPAMFDHSAYFILDKDHNTTCITCHSNSNNFKIYSCYGCHEHSEAKITEEHNEENIYNFDDCASCHRSGDKHDIHSRDNRNDQNLERIRKYVESEKKREERKDRRDKDD